MPVTIKPSPELVGSNSDKTVHSADELLRLAARAWSPRHRRYDYTLHKFIEPENRAILQSSFSDLDAHSTLIAYNNGLVNGILRAFQQDLHLVLRADDVWLSILTQFNLFVNANAEFLRSHFVAHEGKKELMVDIQPYSLSSINVGHFAQAMTLLIHENLVDVELRDWILPNFSTTTDNDKSVAAIVMMGTLQEYFEFSLSGGCGFPSVTLLGERSDWEEILCRVQKLPKYGDQPTEWSRLLIPIIENMIASFDQPNSQQVKDFWLQACHSAGRDGSGNGKIETLSGWLTAFCFWDEKGARIAEVSHEHLRHRGSGKPVDRKRLTLDGVSYPLLRPKEIPKGVITVPVTVQDFLTGFEHKTTMVAGSVGMTGKAVEGSSELTIVQPRSGWWMLQDSVKPIT